MAYTGTMIRRNTIFFLSCIALTMLLTSSAPAQEHRGPSSFEINWNTIDGGGGTSTGGDFSLTGTIGQHDASATQFAGGTFVMSPGFWAKVILDSLFRDGFEE